MARKKFGQLSKKRKAKIRAKAKNQGLTKKQIRNNFNAKRNSQDRSTLGPVGKAPKPSNPFKIQEFSSPFKPGKNFVGPLRDPQPVPTNRSKLTSSTGSRPSAATTTADRLKAAGLDETDLRSGTATGKTTGAEYDLSDASDLDYMKEFDNKTFNKIFGKEDSKTPEVVPENPPKTPKAPEEDVDDIPQVDEKDLYPDLPSFLKNNATYLSGASAGGIRRRRSKRSKLGINAMGTNQLKRNFRNMLSIGGINI